MVEANSKHPDMDNKLYGKSDEELEKVVRERLETLYHPACTCRMAPQAAKGVVDSHLRVYGVAGLRICDASAFPIIVSGHTVSCPKGFYMVPFSCPTRPELSLLWQRSYPIC
jgi:choline dehydrogenase